MNRTAKLAIAGLLAVGLFAAGAVGVVRSQRPDVAGDPRSAPEPAAVLAPGGGNLEQTIASLQERLRSVPTDWRSMAGLGLGYVQEARVTADPTYYPKAEGLLARSIELHPRENEGALVGMAALAAARHDFAGALRYGERARAVDRYDGNVYGVIGDAQLELGSYAQAFHTFQTMVDTLPSLSSYARVSYARELQGDVPGALRAMQTAREVAGAPADIAWASFQIGELQFNRGRVEAARLAYRYGMQADPTYVPDLAGLAKVAWAEGDLEGAIARLTRATRRFPSPEYVIMLGDLQTAAGDRVAAERQYALVRAEARLFRANGVNVDLELALFDADHGAPRAALRAARAEWGRRHSIHVADAYAWALHANGRDGEAARYAQYRDAPRHA